MSDQRRSPHRSLWVVFGSMWTILWVLAAMGGVWVGLWFS